MSRVIDQHVQAIKETITPPGLRLSDDPGLVPSSPVTKLAALAIPKLGGTASVSFFTAKNGSRCTLTVNLENCRTAAQQAPIGLMLAAGQVMNGATVLSGTLTAKATEVRVTFPDGTQQSYAANLPPVDGASDIKPFIADLGGRGFIKLDALTGSTVISTLDLGTGG
jgi:hypothetical protein